MDFVIVAPERNDALLHNHHKLLGGWEPIENIKDPKVQEMGRFAVMEHTPKLVGASMKFICVVSGETQLVSQGIVYKLDVKVEVQIISYPMMTPSVKFYKAVVLEKPIDRSWQLLSYDPSN